MIYRELRDVDACLPPGNRTGVLPRAVAYTWKMPAGSPKCPFEAVGIGFFGGREAGEPDPTD
jgi:hypothetical protein